MRMKRVIPSLVAMVGVGLLAGVPVRAHHGFYAEYDANKLVKITGTIVKVEWSNPHCWFYLDVKTPDGQVERWAIEGGNPAQLSRRGFTKTYLAPGTEIVVEGFLSKGQPHRANGRSMTFPDGRTLFVGSPGSGAPDGKDPSAPK